VRIMSIGRRIEIMKEVGPPASVLDRFHVRQMRGSLSRRSVPDTSAFERGNYIKTLSSYTLEKPTTLQ
jgi:hypothetical protein